MTSSARDRMVEAAFTLFDEQGYDATTVEQIVDRAGVSRSTFFRAFGSKEDVIFPRHVDVQARIEARLETGSADTFVLAVQEAAGLVLEHYLAEGPLALSRYRLTRSVPVLRDREIASMLGYQRVFREYARRWMEDDGLGSAELRAELLAAAVVTAHNVVLRRYLRGTTGAAAARREFRSAMTTALGEPGPPAPKHGASGTAIVVLRSDMPVEEVLRALRETIT